MKFPFFNRDIPKVNVPDLQKCREVYNGSLERFNKALQGKSIEEQRAMLKDRPVMSDLDACQETLKNLYRPK